MTEVSSHLTVIETWKITDADRSLNQSSRADVTNWTEPKTADTSSAQCFYKRPPANVETIFAPEEREKFRSEAGEIAKQRLEPKELDADHRKISPDASRQAMTTFRQLEKAHNLYQFSDDKAKINDAFMKLDREAAHLSKIRQNYDRSEKLAALCDGIKTDIADLLKKNPGERGQNFVEQAGVILTQNFEKAGVFLKSFDNPQVDKLSREIVNRIEGKQKTEIREFAGQNLTSQNTIKTHSAPKIEKAKDSFVFAR